MKNIGKPPTGGGGPASQQSISTGPNKIKKTKHPHKMDWDDSGAVKPDIPLYRLTEDKYAAGYIAGLKRQKRLKSYIN